MTLLPGAFKTKVRATIQNTKLSKSVVPDYEALSYAWGSMADPNFIYIQEAEGESALAITQNLAEALHYLRYEDRSRVLWIDAICVDQSDIKERGHQVLRMADIYSLASRVLIWLGPEHDDSTLAIQELDALGSTIKIEWDKQQVKTLSGDGFDQWIEQPLPFAEDRIIQVSIESLLDRSWFQRLWIWQEVRLANVGALIICGGTSMLWDTFRNAICCLNQRPQLSAPIRLEHLLNICNYGSSRWSLMELLYSTRYAHCSDERDKVYAILSLSHDFCDLEPDYSKSTEDVFKSVVIRYASTLKNLDVLKYCEMRENNETRVPSWVPDWTSLRECKMLFGSTAYLDTEAQGCCDEENVLVVSGCLVATLDVIEPFPPMFSLPSSTTRMRKIVSNLIGGRTGLDPYVAGGSLVDAICRTLCCNYFAENYLPVVTSLPGTEKSIEYMRNLMDNRELIERWSYVDQVDRCAEGRTYFRTRSGHIGLGPSSIQPEDQACMVLGSDALLILRTMVGNTYRVVGECYIDGFMKGEAFLGALPSKWQLIQRYVPDLGCWYKSFINMETGDVQVEDPRLGPLPAGWRYEDHEAKHAYNIFSNEEIGVVETTVDPRLSPEALKARGVSLQEFRLV